MFARSLLASTVLAASVGLAGPAFAGECPAGQMRADATKPSTAAAKGVTDTVLSMIDLADEKVALKGHMMRVRKLEIQPGGIVPLHSHGNRPALIYIVSDEPPLLGLGDGRLQFGLLATPGALAVGQCEQFAGMRARQELKSCGLLAPAAIGTARRRANQFVRRMVRTYQTLFPRGVDLSNNQTRLDRARRPPAEPVFA
jgi:hypothetical protein